ncbi:MAG: PQQ-binding-like beta-propeller repeat protein [Verrucomicrobiota bacterium]
MNRFASLVVVFILFSSAAIAREWKQAATGKVITAELVKVEDGKVHLRLSDGRVGQVEIISLSLEDQEYIASLEAAESQSEEPAASGDDWPQFRGADSSGISPSTGLKDSWPDGGPDRLWVYDDAGMGYSGFSVVGGKLFTMGTRDEDLMVICIDVASGEEVWSTKIGEDDGDGYNTGWGGGPRSTPTVSDGLVFATGPKGTVACLDAATGSVGWTKSLEDDFDGQAGGWGFSASPTVDGENLILAPGGNDAGMVALKKDTGATVWKASDLKPGKAEYATIQIAEINGQRQYIRLFQEELVGVSAEDGSVIWRSEWPGKTAVIPTPIVSGNQIFITAGYGVGCKLVEIDSSNNASDVWVNKTMKNHHGGVVKVGDYLYGFSDGAGLICQDWFTGELVWNEKGQYTTKGAVHVADGHLYALNEDQGTLSLVPVSSDSYELKGQFDLEPQSPNRSPKGRIWTHPLAVGGKLFLRDQEFIVCYDVSE